MRIGVVTTSFPRTEGEAAGSFVAAHVETLRELGHEVEVVGAHQLDSPLFYGAGAPDELERGGLSTYAQAARFTVRLTREVTRRARGWDLIVAHWLAPSALAALATRAPVLAIAHGGDVHLLRRMRLLGPLLHALRARGARLAFVSDELRTIARRAAPGLGAFLDAAIVQPMGIDVARFTAIAHRPSSPPTLLVVARLVPVKGVDVAIAASGLVRTPSHLVIAGEGPERARLEAAAGARGDGAAARARGPGAAARARGPGATSRARGPGATSRARGPGAAPAPAGDSPACTLELVGAVDAATRDRLLGRASVVIVPSRVLPGGRSEGTPMIAIEALAAGIPVVASAVGGLRELPGVVCVPPDDPSALAAAIERALASPPARVQLPHLDRRAVARRLLEHALCERHEPTGPRGA